MVKRKEKVKRFEILKDGWIKDLSTGLEWGKSSDKYLNFKEANEYCAKESGRLPTRSELESILDLEKYNPVIDTIFKDAKSSYYWSSTKTAWNNEAFWCVSFSYGSVFNGLENFNFSVRPVRSSQ